MQNQNTTEKKPPQVAEIDCLGDICPLPVMALAGFCYAKPQLLHNVLNRLVSA